MSVNILSGRGARIAALLAAGALWIGTLSAIPFAPSGSAFDVRDNVASLPPAHEVPGANRPCWPGSRGRCPPLPPAGDIGADDQQQPFDCACIQPVRKVAGVDKETQPG